MPGIKYENAPNHSQGCQVADLSAFFADFGLMEKLLAEWKNPIRPLPKVA
jgi:hypothetical protein